MGEYYLIMSELSNLIKLLKLLKSFSSFDVVGTVIKFITFSDEARKHGLFALESYIDNLKPELMQDGMQLVVDGVDPELVRKILENKAKSLIQYIADELSTIEYYIFNHKNKSIEIMYPHIINSKNFCSYTEKNLLNMQNDLSQVLKKKVVHEKIEDTDNLFLNQMLSVITSDILQEDLNVIIDSLFNTVLRNNDRNFEIIIEGLLSIQSGDNPRIVLTKLSTSLNDDEYSLVHEELHKTVLDDSWYDEIVERHKENNDDDDSKESIDISDDKYWCNDCFSFEIIVLLANRDVQKILCEIDTFLLAKALNGAGEDVQHKIYANMSKRAAILLRQDVEYMGGTYAEEMQSSQDSIVVIMQKLEEKGELVIPRP